MSGIFFPVEYVAGEPFECQVCGRRSYSTTDHRVGWCSWCGSFTRDTRERTLEIADAIELGGEPALADYMRRRVADADARAELGRS